MRELGSGTTYNTHNTTSLIRTLKYVSDILQTEEAFTVKGYKHTHTHTHASVVGIPAGITSSSLTLVFTIGTGISKSLLKLTKKRKQKHNKIIVLAKNKLNMIDTLLSSALNDSEISHEEFTNIINEANIYENIKENIKELTIEPSSLKRTAL